jgi:hypothetical protein
MSAFRISSMRVLFFDCTDLFNPKLTPSHFSAGQPGNCNTGRISLSYRSEPYGPELVFPGYFCVLSRWMSLLCNYCGFEKSHGGFFTVDRQ